MAIKNVNNKSSSPLTSSLTSSVPSSPLGTAATGNASSTGAADSVAKASKKFDPAMNAQSQGQGVGVTVSEAAKQRTKDTAKAKELAMKSPEVREDKVAAIKARLADGSYNVDSEKIAEGMVRESLMEHIASDWNQ